MTLKPTLLKTNPNAQFVQNNVVQTQKPTMYYTPIQQNEQLSQTMPPKNQTDKKKFLIDFLRMFIGISAITLSVHFLTSGKKQNTEALTIQAEKLSAEVEKLTTELNNLKSNSCDSSIVDKMVERLSEIENNISDTSKITKLAEDVEKLKGKKDPTAIISKKIEKIEQQIGTLQKKQEHYPEIAKDIKAIQQELGTLKGKANSKSIKTLKNSITSLERKTTELQTSLENAQKTGIQSISEATANSTTAAVKKISQAATTESENIIKLANEKTSAIQQNGEKEVSKIKNETASSISNIETKAKNATTQIKKEKDSALKSIKKEKEDAASSVKKSAKKVVKTVDDWKERQIELTNKKTKTIKSGFFHQFAPQKLQQETKPTPIEKPIEKLTGEAPIQVPLLKTEETSLIPVQKPIEKLENAITEQMPVSDKSSTSFAPAEKLAESQTSIAEIKPVSPLLEKTIKTPEPPKANKANGQISTLVEKQQEKTGTIQQIPLSKKIDYTENFAPDFAKENFETITAKPDEKTTQILSSGKIFDSETEANIPKYEFATDAQTQTPIKTQKEAHALSLATNQEIKATQQKGLYRTPDGNSASGYYIKPLKNNSTLGINIEKGEIVKSTKTNGTGRKRSYQFIKTYDKQHTALKNGIIEDTTTILKTDSPKATTGRKTVITHQSKGGKEIGEIVRTFDVDFTDKKEIEVKRLVSNPDEILLYEMVKEDKINPENTGKSVKYSVKRKQKNGTEAGFEVLPGFKLRLDDVKMSKLETTKESAPPRVLMRTFAIDDEMRNPIYTNGFINALIK